MEAVAKEKRRVAYALVLSFAILALGMVVGGTFYYRNYERHFRDEAEHQLSAIAELKVDELVEYRNERLGDAATFFENAAFSELVRRFLEHTEDADAQQQVQEWAAKYMATDQYDLVRLIDAQGVIRMSVPAGRSPLSSVVAQRVSEVLRSGQVALEDFHRNEHDQRIYLTLLVPILDRSDHSQALGVLALRINPETYLYPFISRWPTPSETVETMLIRRDGNEAVFLNELKFQTNTALTLRIPLNNTNRPAVKAVLGQKGIVEGTDYRRVPVIAYVCAVPNSPWFMVARMDIAEVYAPMYERLWMIILLVSALVLCAGLGAGAIWRHQHAQLYKKQYQMTEALRESEERFGRVFEEGPIGMAMLDEKFRFIQVNPAFASMLGYSEKEMQKMSFTDVTHPDYVQKDVKQMRRLLRGELSVYSVEKRYIAKSGKELWGLVQVSVVRNAAGKFRYFFAIVSDITAHKQAEESLANERALLRTLVDNLPAAIYLKDLAGRKTLANRLELDYVGAASEAEVLGKTDFDFFPPERAAVYQANDQEVIRNGQPRINHESSFTKPDGSVIYLSGSTVPLRDAVGRVIGLAGINYDITDRKRAEERLLKVITQTRCILYSGHVTGPEGWRKHALEPVSPFHWDTPVLNEQTAQKVVPLELAPGERYLQAWERSWNRVDAAQKNWNSGNAFLNDLPFYRSEFRCTDKHGVGHWMQEFVTVQKLAENRWQIFSIATDISDLKRVETELRRSETGLQAILESTADGILAADNKGKVIKANKRFAELWRIPQSLLDAGDDRALLDFVLKQLSDPDAFLKKEQSLSNMDAVEMDTLALKDGRIFERYYFPMVMEGAVIGRVWSFRDITERKQAAQRVADALNFNQTVLRTSPVGIVVFKASGPCLSANEAISRTLGGTREEVLKQNFRQLESWKRSGMFAAAEAALAAQAERGLETQLVTTFGKKVWLSCRFAPFHYEGEPHLLLIIGDITERKQQEEELKQKNSELERFTYTVSHDLKSPLVTVKTFLGYLEQDLARPDMKRVKQDVAYMHTATEKMGQLLDELLNLARVGRKKNPAVRVTFRELAQEAVRLVAGRISTGGVKVQVADAVVTLEGDRPRLMEIWQNLVENACKFMGNQPQPQVEIGVEQRGPETVFFVRDNGAGIDPRYQAKVFGLFEQLNPKGEGTGMGLALVKRIVELHEGRIWVESAGPGQGANFLFTLPGAVILEPEQSS